MSDRWMVILVVGIAFCMFSPLVIIEYGKANCRIEAIKAGVEADKINTACGIK